MKEMRACCVCGTLHPVEGLTEFDDSYLCSACLHSETIICQECGERLWADANAGDNDYEARCYSCHCRAQGRLIHDYCYCPEPILLMHELGVEKVFIDSMSGKNKKAGATAYDGLCQAGGFRGGGIHFQVCQKHKGLAGTGERIAAEHRLCTKP